VGGRGRETGGLTLGGGRGENVLGTRGGHQNRNLIEKKPGGCQSLQNGIGPERGCHEVACGKHDRSWGKRRRDDCN